MRELKNISFYVKEIVKDLPKEVYKPAPSRLILGAIYLILAIIGILSISILKFNFIENLGISIILGLIYGAMGFFAHEILHGTVVKNSFLKEFLGTVFFYPLGIGAKSWHRWHNLNHHRYTQHEKNDPDSWITVERLKRHPFLSLVYKLPLGVRAFVSFVSLSFSFSLHSSRMFFRYKNDFEENEKKLVWIQQILPMATWISLLFLVGFEKWIFAYLLPVFIANFIVMAYISTNHRLNPLMEKNDALANSLTVTVPKFVNILHFNFSYHTEHHLFVGINPKYYPLIQSKIKELWPELYFEMPLVTALKKLYETPRIYEDNTKLLDPKCGKVYGTLGNGLGYKK